MTRRAAAARDVVPGLDGLDEPRDVLRLVLQVAVHRHDQVAAGARQPGMHGGVLAEAALETDGADAGVVGVQALERGERAVGGAVVDDDDLERPAERLELRDRAPQELVERPRLVQHGDDDGQLWRGRRLALGGGLGPRQDVGLRHPSVSVSPQLGRCEELLHEEPRRHVESVAVHVGRDRKDLCGRVQPELAREQDDVVLVLSDAMGEHLQR